MHTASASKDADSEKDKSELAEKFKSEAKAMLTELESAKCSLNERGRWLSPLVGCCLPCQLVILRPFNHCFTCDHIDLLNHLMLQCTQNC